MKRAVLFVTVYCAMVINLRAEQPYEGTTLPGLAAELEPLHRVASDRARTVEERDAALVKVFQECLKSGFDSGKILSIMKEASWLGQTEISECFGVGGMVQIGPSCSNVKRDKTFRIKLYTTWDKPHHCSIEFRLRGTQPDGSLPDAETVLEFLKGRDVLIPNATLTELAICTPRTDGASGRHVVHHGPDGRVEYKMAW